MRFHCSDWARAGWASRKPEGALPWNSSLCFDVTVILSGFPLPAMPQFRASSPLERYHLYSRVRGNGVWFGFGGETRIRDVTDSGLESAPEYGFGSFATIFKCDSGSGSFHADPLESAPIVEPTPNGL